MNRPPGPEHEEEFAPQIPNNVTVGTQLVLLGLSTRLLNTLDRLNLVKVGDLKWIKREGPLDLT
jgi:hypothetical protein